MMLSTLSELHKIPTLEDELVKSKSISSLLLNIFLTLDEKMKFINNHNNNNICFLQDVEEEKTFQLNYSKYNLTSIYFFGEIFRNTKNDILIKYHNEQLSTLADYIEGNSSIVNNENNIFPLYKKLKLYPIDEVILKEIIQKYQTNLNFYELKLNKYIISCQAYINYLVKKSEKDSKKSILINDFYDINLDGNSKVTDHFSINPFYYDEINIELSTVNELVSEKVSNFISLLSNNDLDNYLYKNLKDIINSIDNLYMLNYFEYFHSVLFARIPLIFNTENNLRGDRFNKVFNYYYYKENENKDTNINTDIKNNKTIIKINNIINEKNEDIVIEEQNNVSFDQLFDEVKKELESKEKIINKSLNLNSITHIYINNIGMNHNQLIEIANFINLVKCQIFAWYLDEKKTKELGIINHKLICIVKNVYIYALLNFD